MTLLESCDVERDEFGLRIANKQNPFSAEHLLYVAEIVFGPGESQFSEHKKSQRRTHFCADAGVVELLGL
jgi:hypothetical protein